MQPKNQMRVSSDILESVYYLFLVYLLSNHVSGEVMKTTFSGT